jgi:hypothetical protein
MNRNKVSLHKIRILITGLLVVATLALSLFAIPSGSFAATTSPQKKQLMACKSEHEKDLNTAITNGDLAGAKDYASGLAACINKVR